MNVIGAMLYRDEEKGLWFDLTVESEGGVENIAARPLDPVLDHEVYEGRVEIIGPTYP